MALFRRIETNTVSEAGSSGRMNEDAYLDTGDLVAVFDGASPLVPYVNKNGETGARIAAHIAKNTFLASALGNDVPLRAVARAANQGIDAAMQSAGVNVSLQENRWATVGAAIRFFPRDNNLLEWWKICDCEILLIKQDGSAELLGQYFNHDVETLTLWRYFAGAGVENIRQHTTMVQTILKTRLRMNNLYGGLNGEPEAEYFFQTGIVSLDGVRSILLFTDGLIPPSRYPENEPDWMSMAAMCRAGGMKMLLSEVREIEKSDPECRRYPRTKCHDDATGIGIDLFR